MTLDRLLPLFTHSPMMRILRADHAPFVLGFLHLVFKEGQRMELEQEEFLVSLRDFQEDLRESGWEEMARPAEEYLTDWVGEKMRFLRRFLAAEKDVWMIELTAEAEEALSFIEGVLERQERSFGTESRMQMIVEAIRELVLYASGDAEAQLARLEQEKARIEEKIEALKGSGKGEELSGRQVNERFYLVLGMLRELTGDFRGVEEKFREIVQGLRERERADDERAGDVLEFVLDAEDALKEHPHGASFHAFVSFVLSGERRDDFDQMVDELTALPDLQTEDDGVTRLQGMMPVLTAEATKILLTTQRLSAALRRLLDPRASEENRQLTAELREIMRLMGQDKTRRIDTEIEQGIALESVMARDFWSPSQKFEEVELSAGDLISAEELRKKSQAEYAALRLLDWKRMEKNVAMALRKSAQVPLEILLADEVLEAGLVELLGYLQLAYDDGHIVDDASESILTVRLDGGWRRVRMPRVVFVRQQAAV